MKVEKVERNYKKQWIVIHMERHMHRGEEYTLELHFSGALLTDPQNGIYMETYTDLTTRERRYGDSFYIIFYFISIICCPLWVPIFTYYT